MKKFRLKNSILVVLAIALLTACKEKVDEKQSRVEVLPFYNEPTFTPNWLTNNSQKEKEFHTIPSFELTNQDGQKITNQTFDNKIYVTDFFFTTCPGICPKMTTNMKILQDEFLEDDEVLLLSHSVTPEIDSISRLKEYADEKGINSSKWHLVTGDRNEIYDLGRKWYFVEEDLGNFQTNDDFLHTENFVLIDKNKHIRGIYNGLNKTAIQQLIADIETLKKEI